MASIKLKSHPTDSNDKKANEEAFNKAIKSFQKTSQETKSRMKKYEHFTPKKAERRAKQHSKKRRSK